MWRSLHPVNTVSSRFVNVISTITVLFLTYIDSHLPFIFFLPQCEFWALTICSTLIGLQDLAPLIRYIHSFGSNAGGGTQVVAISLYGRTEIGRIFKRALDQSELLFSTPHFRSSVGSLLAPTLSVFLQVSPSFQGFCYPLYPENGNHFLLAVGTNYNYFLLPFLIAISFEVSFRGICLSIFLYLASSQECELR